MLRAIVRCGPGTQRVKTGRQAGGAGLGKAAAVRQTARRLGLANLSAQTFAFLRATAGRNGSA